MRVAKPRKPALFSAAHPAEGEPGAWRRRVPPMGLFPPAPLGVGLTSKQLIFA